MIAIRRISRSIFDDGGLGKGRGENKDPPREPVGPRPPIEY